MAWIQIEDETGRLDSAWLSEMASMPAPLREAASTLLARIDLGRGRAESWPRLFAPWTSLYPLLQAEGFERADLHLATRLNFAHLAILVYAFVDDRQRDGQIELSEAEADFGRRCYDLAMLKLNDELPDIFPDHPGIQTLLSEYQLAQSARWPSAGAAAAVPHESSNSGQIRKIAGGRAVFGYLAPLALALASGASEEHEALMRRAYDSLVTGLQWGDDAEDWESDWLAGRQNLLLTRLRVEGFDEASLPKDSAGARSIAEALVRLGIVDAALDAANRCFHEAARDQAGLGCHTLSELLGLLPVKVERLRERFASSLSGGRE